MSWFSQKTSCIHTQREKGVLQVIHEIVGNSFRIVGKVLKKSIRFSAILWCSLDTPYVLHALLRISWINFQSLLFKVQPLLQLQLALLPLLQLQLRRPLSKFNGDGNGNGN